MENKVTPGEIVVMAGGALCLIASFLPFYDFPGGFGIDDKSSWGAGLFPVATLIPLFAVVAAVVVALTKFTTVRYPAAGFLGFGLGALLLALTFFAAILALAFLLVDPGFDTPGFDVDRGIGYFLLLIGAIGSVVGAVLMMNERRAAGTGPGTGPPV